MSTKRTPHIDPKGVEIAETILRVANDMHAPVILMNGPGEFPLNSPDTTGLIVRAIAGKYNVPAALHLDHGDSLECVQACINAGYYGGGWTPVEPYAFWSNVAPSTGCGFDMRVKNLDYEALRKLFNAWRGINATYYGDYYPLTKWSMDKDVWMAWQFDRPEAGET